MCQIPQAVSLLDCSFYLLLRLPSLPSPPSFPPLQKLTLKNINHPKLEKELLKKGPFTYSLVIAASEAAAGHAVDSLAQTALLANVQYKEFEAWLLLHSQYWTSMRLLSDRKPAVVLSHGNPSTTKGRQKRWRGGRIHGQWNWRRHSCDGVERKLQLIQEQVVPRGVGEMLLIFLFTFGEEVTRADMEGLRN